MVLSLVHNQALGDEPPKADKPTSDEDTLVKYREQ